MSGYAPVQDQDARVDIGSGSDAGWVFAGDDASIADIGLSANLSVDVTHAFKSLPLGLSKNEVVISVIAPTSHAVERAPLRLVAVLDKSGSMQGEKIRLTIETVKFMLQHLTERDYLGLVAFDTKVSVLAPLTQCSLEGRTQLEAVISRVKVGSQTNLSGGLLRGLELHGEALRQAATVSDPLQRVSFGNTYRMLDEPIAAPEGASPPPAGSDRVHEWCMELRVDDPADAAFIAKVVYILHKSFPNPRIEVDQPPFQCKKVGWGFFKVRAEVHLHDGRIFPLEHELSFEATGRFSSVLLPLRTRTQSSVSLEHGSRDESAVVRSTFLFTDGAANVGIQKTEDLCAAVAGLSAQLAGNAGTISTFGFGADHSDEMLKNIAQTGKGVYCFIENTESIGEAFGEALGGLLSVTHQNVRLCLDLAPGVTLTKACTKYDVEGPGSNPNGSQSTVINIGDLFAEERRDILLDVSLADVEQEGEHNLGTLTAKAFSVLSKSSETTDRKLIAINRLEDACTDRAQIDPTVERHRNRYLASEALAAARAKARSGQLKEARTVLQGAIEALTSSQLSINGCMMTSALLSDLRECLADLRDQDTFTSMGSKKMASMNMAHERQRTCGGTTTSMYCNTRSLEMKSAGRVSTMPSMQ